VFHPRNVERRCKWGHIFDLRTKGPLGVDNKPLPQVVDANGVTCSILTEKARLGVYEVPQPVAENVNRRKTKK